MFMFLMRLRCLLLSSTSCYIAYFEYTSTSLLLNIYASVLLNMLARTKKRDFYFALRLEYASTSCLSFLFVALSTS